jgi:hypothetical protein
MRPYFTEFSVRVSGLGKKDLPEAWRAGVAHADRAATNGGTLEARRAGTSTAA